MKVKSVGNYFALMFAIAVMSLGLLGCKGSKDGEHPEVMQNTEVVRKIIEQYNANIERWYASGDIDKVAEVFAEDCWQMPPHAEPLVGRAALLEFWEQAVQWGEWRFTLRTQDVVVSGPVAVERGRYILKFQAGPTAPPGLESYEDKGNYVVMWRQKINGQWQAVWDAPVSTVPLGET